MSVSNLTNVPRRVRVDRGLYQRPADGRFEAIYTLDGRQRCKTLAASTLTAARREQRELLGKLDKNLLVAPSAVTFADVADEWDSLLEGLVAQGELHERTLETYRTHLDGKILPLLGRRPVQKITPAELDRLITSWREPTPPREKPLSRATVKGAQVPLKGVLDHAVGNGYLAASPFSRVRKSRGSA
jgi:hypothetical protein